MDYTLLFEVFSLANAYKRGKVYRRRGGETRNIWCLRSEKKPFRLR